MIEEQPTPIESQPNLPVEILPEPSVLQSIVEKNVAEGTSNVKKKGRKSNINPKTAEKQTGNPNNDSQGANNENVVPLHPDVQNSLKSVFMNNF